jgi:hypothetical protein
MPEFRPNERHKTSHTLIHDGLDRLEATIHEFKESPATYKPEVLRDILDSFRLVYVFGPGWQLTQFIRDVLYDHLAEEVYVPSWFHDLG